MRRIPLDTQILIWYQEHNPRLSANFQAVLLDVGNELVVSAASWWEMAIKISAGKLATDLPASMAAAARRRIDTLPLSADHFLQVAALPYPNEKHRDPFDRLIIAQALVENIPVLTADAKFSSYTGLDLVSFS